MNFRPCLRALSVALLTLLFAPSSRAQDDDSSRGRVLERGLTDTRIESISVLNSSADDATPTVTKDEGTLYFTSYRIKDKATIFKATRKSLTEWNAPEVFLELPGKENISALSITNDGQHAVMQCCNRGDGLFKSCDIYEAEISGGQLQNIRSLGKTVNSEWWDAHPSISDDGQLLFFTSDRKKGAGGKDIYMSSKNSSGEWGPPILMSFCTSADEMSPMIASDNQTLYFAADGLTGGLGGFDIYVTYRTGDNTWSVPKNLGPSVNSKSDELFFSIPPAEDAIYLSSDRSGGAGGFDLYRISANPVQPKAKVIAFRGRVLDITTGQPVRTNPDVTLTASGERLTNTATGTSYATMAPLGKTLRIGAGADGYVTGSIEVQVPSRATEEGFSEDIKLTPAKAKIVGHVTNVFTLAPLSATVVLEELNEANQVVNTWKAQTNASTGAAYSFDAQPWHKYQVKCELSDYEPHSSTVDIPLKREALITVEREIRLQPSAIDAVMIFFDYDKHDLKPEQIVKADRFIQQVKENPHVRIEVLGHTDDRGTEQYNDKLSERRASAVEDYLLSKGVPRDQLAIVKGFGKTAPLVFGTTEEARAKNRRAEVRIVGKQ
jgi:OmpA-OmpF porin, OOP family